MPLRSGFSVRWIIVILAIEMIHLILKSNKIPLAASDPNSLSSYQLQQQEQKESYLERSQRTRKQKFSFNRKTDLKFQLVQLSQLTLSDQRNITCNGRRTQPVYDVTSKHDSFGFIPPIVHQTSRSRCTVRAFAQAAEKWQQAMQTEYYMHDDDAMDRLVYSEANVVFPHLRLVWKRCMSTGAMKADLWRLLVLWMYGGIFSDLDSMPGNLRREHFNGTDHALFVVDKDKSTSFHFMAVAPQHPIVFLTLQVAIFKLMMVRNTINVNPVVITGPVSLTRGISELLEHTEWRYKKQIHFEYGQHLPRGEYFGRTNDSQFRILGDDSNDMNYWVFREIERKQKRHWYRAMGMRYYADTVETKDEGQTCVEKIFDDMLPENGTVRQYEQIPLPELVDSYNRDITCHPEATPVWDVVTGKYASNVSRIPRIIHQTSKTRCVGRSFRSSIEKWKSFGWDYYMHDDEAMERLVYSGIPEFPHLAIVWKNCIGSSVMKADLWRLLVLWEYGGFFSDLDSAPNKFTPNDIQEADYGIFVVDKDNTTSFHFMGVSPKHPVIFFALNAAIYNLVRVPDMGSANPVKVTGPAALRLGIEQMLDQTKWFYKRRMKFQMGKPLLPGIYLGLQPRSQFRLLGWVDGNRDYWITREMDINVKRASYKRMNMTHFTEERQGTGVSCMAAITKDFRDRLVQ